MLIRISGNSSDVGLQDCRNPLIYWLPWWPFPSSCVNCLCSLSPLAGSVPYSPGKPHQVSPICFVSLYSHSFFLPLCKTKPSQLVLGSQWTFLSSKALFNYIVSIFTTLPSFCCSPPLFSVWTAYLFSSPLSESDKSKMRSNRGKKKVLSCTP